MDKLHSISCDPTCGFMIKSHDKQEVVEMAHAHVKGKHTEMHMTPDQMEAMVKNE